MSVKDNSYGIAELQNKMLDILKIFISICENNNLHYWMAGGSCLGVLRHGGFIPWDDDLDVYMPREDYEYLWENFGSIIIDGGYILCRTTKEKNYHHRVMQLVDMNTTFIHSRCKNEDIEHGVYIDIIPLDGCPDKPTQRFSQMINAVCFSIFNIQCKPEYNGGKLTPIISIFTTLFLKVIRNSNSRYHIWKHAEKKMIKYNISSCHSLKCITSQFHELITPFPKEWFGERKEQFEDVLVSVPSEAEAYCRAMYGDYMMLPSTEKRVVRHSTEYIDLENSYSKYKGVYFFPRE